MTRLHEFIEMEQHRCHVCGSSHENIQKLQEHFDLIHRPSPHFEEIKSALKSTYRMMHKSLNITATPEVLFSQPHYHEISTELKYAVRIEPVARASMYLFGLFEKDSMHESQATQVILPMKTPAHLISSGFTDVDAVIHEFVSELDLRLDEILSSG